MRQGPKGSFIYKMITTTDPKVLGIMYMVTSFSFFLIGGLEDLQKKAESLGAKMEDSGSDGAPASDDSDDSEDSDDKGDDSVDSVEVADKGDDAKSDGEDKSK